MAKSRLTTQPSFKISKKQPTQQFNTLINVLKPKVFITTSSNFKTLVQELTGNGSQSPVHPTTMHVVPFEPTQDVIHIDDHDHSPDPSLDYSLDPSLDNMFMQFDYSSCLSEDQLGLQWPEDPVMDYANREIELGNIESWLLDFDPAACFRDVPFMAMDSYEYDYNLPVIM